MIDCKSICFFCQKREGCELFKQISRSKGIITVDSCKKFIKDAKGDQE